jgi:hypothetical protein
LDLREQHRRDKALERISEVLVGLAHHAPLQRPLADVAREQARLARVLVLDVFDDGRGFVEREAVVLDDGDARAG